MYLEISPRRSGKTTRLIQRANEMCDEGIPVMVCAPTNAYGRVLRDMGLYSRVKFVLNVDNFFSVYKYTEKPEDYYILYDEFDTCEDIVYRQDNIYYVTTPHSRDNYNIKNLVEKNNEEYISYKTHAKDLYDIRVNIGKSAFEKEYECKWDGKRI